MDWRDEASWGCNARRPPGGEFEYDGITTHPLEVMFAFVTRLNLYAGHPAARAAKRYDVWQQAQVSSLADALLLLSTVKVSYQASRRTPWRSFTFVTRLNQSATTSGSRPR